MKGTGNIVIMAIILVMAGGFYVHIRSHSFKPGDMKPNAEFAGDSLGERVYEKHCLTCHQKDGSGVPSMYPPIVNNPRVKGGKERLTKIIIEGQTGKIEVHGRYYNGVMPPFRDLSNREVAAVLTYMRKGFENDTTAVTVQEVKAVRDTL
ncbi:MAG: c-type cytochrome [Bacteroidales bacterium]